MAAALGYRVVGEREAVEVHVGASAKSPVLGSVSSS